MALNPKRPNATEPFYPSPAIIRGALGLLNLTKHDFCGVAKIAKNTLAAVLGREALASTDDTLMKIRNALVERGISWEDLRDRGGGMSVRYDAAYDEKAAAPPHAEP